MHVIFIIEGDIIKRALNLFKSKELVPGYLFFYIHFALEVVCFFYLSRVTNNSPYIWLIPFIYDGLAFVPQSIIGYISDKFPKINIGLIGVFLLLISYLIFGLTDINVFVSLIILCIGNAFIHVSGAETTLRSSKGKLSPVAIYVAGGSFGVISGKLLANASINPLLLIILILSMIPFILISKSYISKDSELKEFDYVREGVKAETAIILAFLVVTIRGYMGYGIPTSWNNTVTETVIMFSVMGLGKALGGILSDLFDIRKVAIISTLLSIPFLCFGNDIMIISLIGLMFFSMTMAITVGILVSKLRKAPGLAFGITTIGLFLGTAPTFFVRLNMTYNIILILVASVLSLTGLYYVLKGAKK